MSPRGFRSCLVYVYTLNLNQIACAFSLNNKETIVIDLLSQFDDTIITSYSQADYNSLSGASYFLGRTFSSVPWGIFADKYGRKPCIVISILSV
jgi:MFS family permease